MKINTTFDIWNTIYLLDDRKCYKGKIIDVVVSINEEWEEHSYIIEKIIPKGLLSEDIHRIQRNENMLFLSKWDVMNKLEEIKNAEDLLKQFPDSKGWFYSDGTFYGSDTVGATFSNIAIASN